MRLYTLLYIWHSFDVAIRYGSSTYIDRIFKSSHPSLYCFLGNYIASNPYRICFQTIFYYSLIPLYVLYLRHCHADVSVLPTAWQYTALLLADYCQAVGSNRLKRRCSRYKSSLNYLILNTYFITHSEPFVLMYFCQKKNRKCKDFQ